MGRAAIAGITQQTFAVDSYNELIIKEAEVVGVADHLGSDLTQLMKWASEDKLDFSHIISGHVPLNADAINPVLDRMDSYGSGVRTVIVPDSLR